VEREQMQEGEYEFPYHYLPHVDEQGASNLRFLRWGLEYSCYMEHIAGVVHDLAPASHLDAGCGDARLFHLTRGIAGRRVGVDFSPRSLDYARAFNPDAEFRCDLDGLPAGERFDLVSAVEVLEHIPDDEIAGFLQSLRQRLSPGGHLLVSVPSTALPVHPKHYRHYDEALLRRQVLGACGDLEEQRIEHVYRDGRVVDAVMRATMNRFWVVEIAPLRRWLWRRVWRRQRLTRPGVGRHVVGLFRAPS
jgi:SAM-dependent methyltransferase